MEATIFILALTGCTAEDFARGDSMAEACDWAHEIRRTPCEYEDDTDCFWNAATRGNGLGDSFMRVNGKHFYLPPEDAAAIEAAGGRS